MTHQQSTSIGTQSRLRASDPERSAKEPYRAKVKKAKWQSNFRVIIFPRSSNIIKVSRSYLSVAIEFTLMPYGTEDYAAEGRGRSTTLDGSGDRNPNHTSEDLT